MNIHVLKFLLMLSTTILLTFSIISCSEDNEVIDFSNIGTQFNEAGLPIDIPNNMIVYKSESGEIIDVFEDNFGEARVKSNVYDKAKGYGVITFWDEVKDVAFHEYPAFSGYLRSIVLPKSFISIGGYAFGSQSYMTSITMQDGLQEIKDKAFLYCEKLTNVIIPNSVVDISNNAFGFCRNLNQILVDEKNPIYDSKEDCNAIIKTKTNELIVGCNNTQIPNSVKSIGDNAFFGSGIKSIVIPDSILNVGSYAFAYCDSLKLITVMSSTPPTCTDNSFSCGYGNYSNATLYVPAGSKEIYQKTQGWSKFKNIVEGNFTENITWDFNSSTGTLLIEGEGKMPNYSLYNESPFDSNDNIKSVKIGDGVLSIGEYAFYNCTGITSIDIPNTVMTIGQRAFVNCMSLSSIIIPNSVTNIGDNAFFACHGLTSIIIPSSMKNIGNGAFAACGELANIKVKDGNTIYDSRENCNAIIETETNTLIVGCKNTIIPSSVTNIGEEAFYGSDLTTLIIPEGVEFIGNSAFYGCDKLTTLEIQNSTPPAVGTLGLGLSDKTKVIVPNGSLEAYKAADGWKDIPNIVEKETLTGECGENVNWSFNTTTGHLIIEGEGEIKNYNCLWNICEETSPFESNEEIKSIEIKNGVTNIGDAAFSSCMKLNTVIIPNSVTRIGNMAFFNCDSLTSITIPNSVTHIEWDAFTGCDGLKSITIPSSVKTIRGNILQGCERLSTIRVAGENTFYDSRDNCNAIIETSSNSLISGCKSTVIPSSVTNISWSAFYGCLGLSSIIIPHSVTKIDESAFFSCSSLTTLVIPESVVFIGDFAFQGCDKLTTLEIQNSTPPSVGTLGLGLSYKTKVIVPNGSLKAYKAADGWKDIPNIVEKETLTGECGENVNWSFNTTTGHLVIEGEGEMWNYHLGYNSPFNSNEDVKSIEIKEGVTNIGPKVFYNCINLANVDIPNTVTSIENQAFYGCTGLKYITVPASVVNIGHNTFEGCNNLTTIEMQGSIPPSVGTLGLSLTEKTKVIVPNGSLETYKTADGWKDVLNMVENRILIGECGDNVTWNFNFVTSHLIIKGKGNMRDYSYYSTPSPFMDFKENIYSVEIEDGVESIGANTFCFCSNLNRIEIPKSVSTLGIGAFEGCSSLTNVNLPDYLKVIGSRCFFECSNITEIVIPNLITSIGMQTFDGCSKLENVTLPDFVEEIGDLAFYGCVSLTEIIIPPHVKSIGMRTFDGCTSLNNVTIPSSVTNIGPAVFYGCSSLTEITIHSLTPPNGNWTYSFPFDESHYQKVVLKVPASSKSIYETTEPWSRFEKIEAI